MVRILVLIKRKRRRGYDRFRVRAASPLSYLRLRRSTYSDAASADTAAIARPLNSGTGMLLIVLGTGFVLCQSVRLIRLLTRIVTHSLGSDMVNWYVPGGKYASYTPS